MWKKNRWMRPERVMALGFLALIVLGGVLLSLPCAAQNGRSIGLGNGLFTATSAVCVTGLVAVDTGTTFSLFGQLTLLLLIQIGGLGFMAFATLTMVLLGRKIGLRDRMLLRESMNTSGLSGLVRLTRWYLTAALVIEGGGAVLLAIRFVPLLGWGKGVYFSIFHAVSAFCNAGFDLFGHFSSLTAFQNEPLVLLTISTLMFCCQYGRRSEKYLAVTIGTPVTTSPPFRESRRSRVCCSGTYVSVFIRTPLNSTPIRNSRRFI